MDRRPWQGFTIRDGRWLTLPPAKKAHIGTYPAEIWQEGS